MDISALHHIILRNSSPLSRKCTGISSSLHGIPGIRAVLFDVYGTLFISASGDIGSAEKNRKPTVFLDAFRNAGFTVMDTHFSKTAEKVFFQNIETSHTCDKEKGIRYPEINILHIWEKTCVSLYKNGLISSYHNDNVFKLAVEYETRVNPVWPMTDLAVLFSMLRSRGTVLGIVSNAQFYTPLLFPSFLGKSLKDFGFLPELCIWSYRHGEAKPSSVLFQYAADQLLHKYSILPENILYIGNDMLNDIAASSACGMKTALFAGDSRSLRLRNDHSSCKNIQPDVILTELEQLDAVLC